LFLGSQLKTQYKTVLWEALRICFCWSSPI
jgi:hypothetical protein